MNAGWIGSKFIQSKLTLQWIGLPLWPCTRCWCTEPLQNMYRSKTRWSIKFKDSFNDLMTSNESKLYVHLSPNEKIPEYLLTFTWKQNVNTIQEIDDKNRSERVWNFWHPFRCRYNFETKVLKIEVYTSCRFKSNRYFSQKVNTIKDKSDFLALHSYFWTKVLVRISMLNISVLSSLWKHLHRSFGSFRFHRLDCFYCLQCFYHSFCFYHTFVTFLSFVWFLFWVSFRTRVLSYLWRPCSCVCCLVTCHWHMNLDFSFNWCTVQAQAGTV